jgi:hypothetical protein
MRKGMTMAERISLRRYYGKEGHVATREYFCWNRLPLARAGPTPKFSNGLATCARAIHSAISNSTARSGA